MGYSPDKLIISNSADELFKEAAACIAQYANECVQTRGVFSIALAGGGTPKRLYQQLTSSPLIEQIPWASCHFYFGDERMVPHDHDDSNYAMAHKSLFERAPIPAGNIHPIPTDCDTAQECANRYAQEIGNLPGLDLVLLGIGQDGHTASLFPGTDILHEDTRPVSAVYVEKFRSWRISMTYPLINRAKQAIVLISGSDKSDIVHQVLNTDNPDVSFPIQGIRPLGRLSWFVDKDAYAG